MIGDRPLSELVPLYRDPKSDMPVTQFNMKWVEQAGLVKFDFLGLKTLTVLQTAVRAAASSAASSSILSAIPLDDKKTYDMLSRAEAVGIFQLESQGMRRALLDMRPDRFEDIIALVALYRPGPMANIPTYCARKHGHGAAGIHPSQARADPARDLRRHRLSGTGDAGRADPRRLYARPGRSAAPRHGQEDPQGDGGAAQAISSKARPSAASSASQAEAIFDLLERFAEYGFNKSHAAAYALVAYQTAYMKANYPVEFLAASMTLDMGNTDKLSEFRAEAERLGIKVEPPSVNRSGAAFEVEGNTIHYALAALKGVGRQAVEAIVAARGDKPFADLTDFARRINPRAVNKRVLESLAAAGAFDALEPNRARAHAAVDAMHVDRAAHATRPPSVGQNELFGGAVEPRDRSPLPAVEPWLPADTAAARIRRHRLLPVRPSARRIRGAAAKAARCSRGPSSPAR